MSFADISQQNWYLISKAVYSTVLLVKFNIAKYIKLSSNFFSRTLIFTDLLVNTRKAGFYTAKLSKIPFYLVFRNQEILNFLAFNSDAKLIHEIVSIFVLWASDKL